jgi:hypothetical protein
MQESQVALIWETIHTIDFALKRIKMNNISVPEVPFIPFQQQQC